MKEMPPEKIQSELWKEVVSVFWADNPDKVEEIRDELDGSYTQNVKNSTPVIDDIEPDEKPVEIAPTGSSSMLQDLIGGVLAKFNKKKSNAPESKP
jgi:hypothetical protein